MVVGITDKHMHGGGLTQLMPLYSMGKSKYNPFQVFGNKKTHFNAQIQSTDDCLLAENCIASDPPGGMGPLASWTSNFQIQAKSLGIIYFAAKGHSDQGACA